MKAQSSITRNTERIITAKKKKASDTEQRNSERNRFLNNEIYFEHYCGWNYFPLKTKGSHQLYILSSYDTKK